MNKNIMDTVKLFETIKEKSSNKKIQILCNKLIKKLSFKGEDSMSNLQYLSFWLYIHGQNDDAIKVINLTNEMVFNGKYNIWDYVHTMWALKARILRQKGEKAEAQSIIDKIIEHNLTPDKFSPTKEEKEIKRKKYIERVKYEDISYKEEIEESIKEGNLNSADLWRFSSIATLIRYKEENAYPEIIKKDKAIESEIEEYISILKK